MQVQALFGGESALVERIGALRAGIAERSAKLKDGDALRAQLSAFDAKADAVRKQIVATKEGGAITGEERLREHTDQLYGAVNGYEGRPGSYHFARIAAIRRELGEVQAQFAKLVDKDLRPVNDALKAGGQEPLPVLPAELAADDEAGHGGGGGVVGGRIDPDAAVGVAKILPNNFTIYR